MIDGAAWNRIGGCSRRSLNAAVGDGDGNDLR